LGRVPHIPEIGFDLVEFPFGLFDELLQFGSHGSTLLAIAFQQFLDHCTRFGIRHRVILEWVHRIKKRNGENPSPHSRFLGFTIPTGH
jgi:hypothetical protein